MTGKASIRGPAGDGTGWPGVVGWLTDTDHKINAIRIAVVAFGFFAISGAFALTMRLQLAQPGMNILSENAYNQLMTMHGSGMIYLFFTPMLLAMGVYLVPLQVGAAQIAIPRLAVLGFWLQLFGGLVMFSGFLTDNGAAAAGWTAYYPLSSASGSPGMGMDFWVIGVGVTVIGSTLLAVSIMATIIRLRAPGMTILRVPVFSMTMLVTSFMIVATFPVLAAAMVLLFADRHLGGIFDTANGPILYQHLFWFYGHPVVYIMFFPFIGAVAEVVATFSRKRLFGYRTLIIALLLFSALSMSVWAHHMFTTGAVTNQYFATTSHLLAIPAGIEYFDLIATMIGGAILLRTPMLFALGFILQFLIGGLTGVFIASPVLDYHVHDSAFIVAHFHYTLFAGSAFGFFAGFYYWFPKVTGRLLSERLGKIHFFLLVIGANLTFFPMFFSGFEGMPRRVSDYTGNLADLNLLSTIGAFTILVAMLVFTYNLFASLRRKDRAGPDPWQGQTLEWWAESPPPRHNFTSLPEIGSHAPLLDLTEAAIDADLAATEAGIKTEGSAE